MTLTVAAVVPFCLLFVGFVLLHLLHIDLGDDVWMLLFQNGEDSMVSIDVVGVEEPSVDRVLLLLLCIVINSLIILSLKVKSRSRSLHPLTHSTDCWGLEDDSTAALHLRLGA